MTRWYPLKALTRKIIDDFRISSVGYDFMGYSPQKPSLENTLTHPDILCYHHLLIPRRNGGPYAYWNGAILYTTPHEYLHLIEALSPSLFHHITSEMQDMKVKRFLDPRNLAVIDEILSEFEYTHADYRSQKTRKRVLKPQYLNRNHPPYI